MPDDVAAGRPVALIGWEFGDGLRYAYALSALADAAAAAGFTPVIAARDVVIGGALTGPSGLLQAPIWRPPARLKVSAIGRAAPKDGGLADTLAIAGLGAAESLPAQLAAWDGLLDLVQPVVVIALAAPGLVIAAAERTACLAVGDGDDLPPDVAPLPRRDPLAPPVEREARLLGVVGAALERRGVAPFERLARVFRGDAACLASALDFDPYAPYRTGSPWAGPLVPPRTPAQRRGEGIAVLLRYDRPAAEDVLFGLAAARRPGTAVIWGGPAQACAHLAEAGLAPSETLPPLETLLTARLIVHHGETLMTEAAADAGVPQLILPKTAPERRAGEIVVRAGAGRVFTPERDPVRAMRAAVEAASGDRALGEAARGWARARATAPRNALASITATLSGTFAERGRGG